MNWIAIEDRIPPIDVNVLAFWGDPNNPDDEATYEIVMRATGGAYFDQNGNEYVEPMWWVELNPPVMVVTDTAEAAAHDEAAAFLADVGASNITFGVGD